jgi:ATP-binding cassette subfamily B protein
MRFYDVQSGAIYVDGVDIKDYKRSEVRKLFGMVLQDTWLFQGSIRHNIAYHSLGQDAEVDMEKMKIITKEAHIDHFIMSQPKGYETCLNENADNISNGQKQLLTIARAMYEDSPMLILDEATSSVDTRSEILIQRAMANLLKNRTSFIIAHRLSTIRDADLILVMKEGEIVEMGNHEGLMKQAGFYQELYNSQFED